MAGETYSVVFSGDIADGKLEDEVRENVARAFQLKASQVSKLFSGKPIALKRGLDRAEAIKYRNRLARAGALGKIVVSRPQEADAATAPTGQASSADAEPAADTPTTSPPASQTSAPTPAGGDPDTLECPRCGHEQPFAEACTHCGTDLRLHIRRLERRQAVRSRLREQARTG